MTGHRAKLVRPVWETGQTGFGLDSREELNPRENSNLQAIDLPIRTTDQSETLGIVGVPRGLPLAKSSVPKTHSIKRNRKSTLKNTSHGNHRKQPNRSRFGGFVGPRSPSKEAQEFLKETTSKLPHGKSKKRLRKSPKRENGRNTIKT
jgi:hypothetical protein